MAEIIKFTVQCEMKARWVPHFIGMLKTMQRLGSLGSSRVVGLYADGDGDFRPKFDFGNLSVVEADPLHKDRYEVRKQGKEPAECDYFYDAG